MADEATSGSNDVLGVSGQRGVPEMVFLIRRFVDASEERSDNYPPYDVGYNSHRAICRHI